MVSNRLRRRAPVARRYVAIVASVLAYGLLAGCMTVRAPTHPELATVAQQGDALALSDALEALIAADRDTPTDRAYAYQVVRNQDADTAATAFARASITGRLVQSKGLRAADLVSSVERDARHSRELDPNFSDGAATQLLGTLYVVAPATLLEHGDSEVGLELLEEVTAAHPDSAVNHLRLAEAYVTLHDPDPASPHLCFCLARQATLTPENQRLLKGLLDETGPPSCAPAAPPGR
jgi:hypothetical protein